MALSGDFSIIPAMEYLVMAYAWGLQNVSVFRDTIFVEKEERLQASWYEVVSQIASQRSGLKLFRLCALKTCVSDTGFHGICS